MSNYRDDTQETAVASSDTWLGLSTLTESIGRISVTLMFGLGVVHADQATASDAVIDQASHTVVETATAGDEVIERLAGSVLITERARISEAYRAAHGVVHSDEAKVSDEVFDRSGAILTDYAAISDAVIGQRTGHSVVVEQARVSDFSGQVVRDLVEAQARASDLVADTLAGRDLVLESAQAFGVAIDAHRSVASPAIEIARVSAEVVDSLSASDLVVELAVIEDEVTGATEETGMAWTANVENWAMSRYQPYGFSHIAVIDGIAYGEAEDGVYALSGGTEQIEGEIVTGKLDLGRGTLVHPTTAYLEYALAGKAEMDVTTTQAGAPQTYTYTLPAETADHLTNGRFQFGRGLRGRHFSFALRMTGEHGHINDLSVQTAQTKRRV